MPKSFNLIQFADPGKPVMASAKKDHPCPIATIQIHENTVRVYVKSEDAYIWAEMPYGTYNLQWTVPQELYPCLGFNRREEDYEVTIWDKKHLCKIIIPAIKNDR